MIRPTGNIPRVVPGSTNAGGGSDEAVTEAATALVPSANTPLTKDASFEDSCVVIRVLFWAVPDRAILGTSNERVFVLHLSVDQDFHA